MKLQKAFLPVEEASMPDAQEHMQLRCRFSGKQADLLFLKRKKERSNHYRHQSRPPEVWLSQMMNTLYTMKRQRPKVYFMSIRFDLCTIESVSDSAFNGSWGSRYIGIGSPGLHQNTQLLNKARLLFVLRHSEQIANHSEQDGLTIGRLEIF